MVRICIAVGVIVSASGCTLPGRWIRLSTRQELDCKEVASGHGCMVSAGGVYTVDNDGVTTHSTSGVSGKFDSTCNRIIWQGKDNVWQRLAVDVGFDEMEKALTTDLNVSGDPCRDYPEPSSGGQWCNGHSAGSLTCCWGWCAGGCWGNYFTPDHRWTHDGCSIGNAPLCQKGGSAIQSNETQLEPAASLMIVADVPAVVMLEDKMQLNEAEDEMEKALTTDLNVSGDPCRDYPEPSSGGQWCNGHTAGSLTCCWGWCAGGCWGNYFTPDHRWTHDGCSIGNAPLCQKGGTAQPPTDSSEIQLEEEMQLKALTAEAQNIMVV